MAHFANPDDLLGLAVEDQIVLVDHGGGLRQDPVKVMDESGGFIASATKLIRPRNEFSLTYELLDGSTLVLSFGALIGSVYVLTGLQVSQEPDPYVRAVINFISLTNPNMFNLAQSKQFSVEVSGGRGIVDIYGCTIASPGDALDASLSVQTQSANVIKRDTGDFQEAGYAIFGGELQYRLSATGAITLPAGAFNIEADSKKVRNDFGTYAKSWTMFPTYT